MIKEAGPRYHVLRPAGNSLVRVSRGVPLPHFPGRSLKRSCTSVQRSSHANKLSPN
jgi:hypothetical protein